MTKDIETSKPGCRIVGSVTVVWLTTEADDQSSLLSVHAVIDDADGSALRPSHAVLDLCYDRRTRIKQYARYVTVQPGASTVAGVVNIARPSVSVFDSSGDDRRPVWKFSKSRVCGKVPEGYALILAIHE